MANQFKNKCLVIIYCHCFGGGLMGIALVSGAKGLVSSPARGYCVLCLIKTLYSHSAFLDLHTGVKMGIGEFNVGGNTSVD